MMLMALGHLFLWTLREVKQGICVEDMMERVLTGSTGVATDPVVLRKELMRLGRIRTEWISVADICSRSPVKMSTDSCLDPALR